MGAAFIAPELALAPEESKELTAALAEVNSFYSQAVDPKVVAWMGLIGVAGKIYGPRAMAIFVRKQADRERKKRQPSPLAGMPPAAAPKPVAPDVRNVFTDPGFVPSVQE